MYFSVYFILASAKIEVSLHCSVSTMSTHRQLQVLLCFPFHVPMLIDAHANIVQAIMMNARSVCTSHIPIYSKPFHSSQSQRVSSLTSSAARPIQLCIEPMYMCTQKGWGERTGLCLQVLHIR